MPRDVVLSAPNKGLTFVSPAGERECDRAENVNFTRSTIKRRPGKRASHAPPESGAFRVTALKRFYDLATTGTVTKKMIEAISDTSNPLWCPDSDWSDATAATIVAFTQQKLPNTGDNSLYTGYDAGPITTTKTIREFVQSNSWLYCCPQFPDASDTDDKTIAVPLRTQCDGKVYLQGLVPPVPLDIADVEGANSVPSGSSWTSEEIDSNIPVETGPGCLVMDATGRIHAAYIRSSTPYYNVRDTAGTWGTPVQIDAGTTITAWGSMALAVDQGGAAHVSYYQSGTGDLYYGNNKSGSFVTEAAQTTGTVGRFSAIVIDESGLPHILYDDATNFELRHTYRSISGTWSTPDTIDTTINAAFHPAAIYDSQGRLHVVYGRSGTTRDIYYAVAAADGTWGAAGDVYSTADNVDAPVAIDVDSSDNPGVLFVESTATDLYYAKYNGSSWDAPESVFSSAPAGGAALFFDGSDVPHASWTDSNSVYYSNRQGGSWAAGATVNIGTGKSILGILQDSDAVIYIGANLSTTVRMAILVRGAYRYKLTAEYDDAILGESGPSASTAAYFEQPLSGFYAHDLLLKTGTGVYDMTNDVTRIYIYRTVASGVDTSTFYRVGYVDCTAGVPDADFTDNVSDEDLITGVILDEDKYLPPRYRTSVFWKDRFVIGNLECRDTSDSTQLDYEEDGIHKNRIRYSDAFHPDIYKANFFQDIVPDGNSGSIQRLIVNPTTDTLYVFMESDVVALGTRVGDLVTSLSFLPANVAGAAGTPSPYSVLHHDGRIFYWTKTGIEVIEGYRSRSITTHSIAPLWNQLDTTFIRYVDRVDMSALAQVAGVVASDVLGERIYWSYQSGSTGYSDKILCLHYSVWKDRGFQGDPPFTIYSGWRIRCFCKWNGEGDRGELFGGESVGTDAVRAWIYRLDFGNEDVNGNGAATATAAITSYVNGAYSEAGRPDLLKSWRMIRLEGTGGATGVTLAMDLDDGKSTVTIDSISWASGNVRRYPRNLPHYAIATQLGVHLTVQDTLDGSSHGPSPLELYAIAYTLMDIRATPRGSG